MMKTGTSLTLLQDTLQLYFQFSASVMLLEATPQLYLSASTSIMMLQATPQQYFKFRNIIRNCLLVNLFSVYLTTLPIS
jgi:hypothetical protein